MHQVKNSGEFRHSEPENQDCTDRIDRKICAAVNKPACFHAVIVIADPLQKECRRKERRDAEQQHRDTEPTVHDAEMIDRKCQRTEDCSGLGKIGTPECFREESAEKRFFQKRIDERDICENEQAVTLCELFLLHEILPDRRKIKIAEQINKSNPNQRNHCDHNDEQVFGFLHFPEPDAFFQRTLGKRCADTDQSDSQEQLDEAFDEIGRCEQLFRQHHANSENDSRRDRYHELPTLHAFRFHAIASATNSRALRSAAATSS